MLIDKCVAPAIANRAMNRSVSAAHAKSLSDISKLDQNKDLGYCTKVLMMPLYELQAKYGGLEFLQKDVEKAVHPKNLKESFDQKYIKDNVDLSSKEDMKHFKQGDIVIVDDRHAMFFDGIQNKMPRYVGFNNDVEDFAFLSERRATVIELTNMINDNPPTKNLTNEVSNYRLGNFEPENISIPVLSGL